MKKFNFLISLYLIPLKSIFSGLLDSNSKDNSLLEDKELEFSNDNKNNYSRKNQKPNNKNENFKKKFDKTKFDIGDSLRILYKNYSNERFYIYNN